MVITKEQVFSNFTWRFFERIGAQLVSFIVTVILARLLLPEDYGVVALLSVFINILQVFVDSGLGNALIQKKDADNIDFSTVFYTNIIFCLIIYILLFFLSPFLAKFYNNDLITNYIRVLGITIVISGIRNVQQAYISKNLIFKQFFFATLSGTLFAAFIGIFLAYRGFGVWALITQQLVNLVINTCILWLTIRWRPINTFSFSRLRVLFSFGWKLLLSALLATIYEKLAQLMIGKKYSSHELAYYNKGETFPLFFIQNIDSSLSSVLLPSLSKEQDNKERIKSMARTSIKVSTFVIFPLLIGLFVVTDNLILLLLTDKWIGCVPYLRIFCITYLLRPVFSTQLNVYTSCGRSDLYLKVEIIKKVAGFIPLFIAFPMGPLAIAYSILISCLLEFLIDSWPNRKLINYKIHSLIIDILPNLLISIIMGCIVYFIGKISCKIPLIFALIIQVFVGFILYVVLSILTKNTSFQYLKNLLANFLEQRTRKL